MHNEYKLPFEDRYSYEYAKRYHYRHRQGFLKKISNRLEQHMAAKALKLAGFPKVILDLPCGAGRFWQTLIAAGAEKIIAADQSPGMLQVAKEMAEPNLLKKITFLQTDATSIDLPNNAVESVVCMRLLHHIDSKDYRQAIFKELRRVASQSVCISFWVEGSYKSYREYIRAQHANELSRCLNPTLLENELAEVGFKVIGKVDMLKYFLYWRTYVLKV